MKKEKVMRSLCIGFLAILVGSMLFAEIDSYTGATPKVYRTYAVKSISLFKDNAGRPKWSPDGNYIAYHARNDDGYYDVFIMDADGGNEKCLTRDHPDLPNKHVGQPSWHPSGKWIVFQAEKKKHVLARVSALTVPGIGWHNDVYVMSFDGREVFQLTDLRTKMRLLLDSRSACAVLQPHFSHDGTLLSWSERIGNGGRWGKWVIRIADFAVDSGIPKIYKIRTFTPGKNAGYCESNDFTPDDRELVICGNLEVDQDEFGLDIYTIDLQTEVPKRLTHTIDEFDECPHPSVDGKKIAYLSTHGFGNADESELWWEWARGEFWLMDADGGNKQQLTHFNSPGYPEYAGKRIIPAYLSWHPDGSRLLLGIAVEVEKKDMKDQIWLLEFE